MSLNDGSTQKRRQREEVPGKMVLAQGLGDANRQALPDEKGDRRPGATISGDHAPHLGGWHRVPVDARGNYSSMTAITMTDHWK
jgi:hypothetical protein